MPADIIQATPTTSSSDRQMESKYSARTESLHQNLPEIQKLLAPHARCPCAIPKPQKKNCLSEFRPAN